MRGDEGGGKGKATGREKWGGVGEKREGREKGNGKGLLLCPLWSP